MIARILFSAYWDLLWWILHCKNTFLFWSIECSNCKGTVFYLMKHWGMHQNYFFCQVLYEVIARILFSFFVLSSITEHLKTNLGEKPHVKNVPCHYHYQSVLKKQLRTYSREMFTRIECFKSFSEAGSFKRHLRTHSREKARSHFVFKGCYKSFSVSISLTFCSPPTNSFRILKREAPKNTYRREAICLKECSKSSSVSLKRQLGTKSGEKPFTCIV